MRRGLRLTAAAALLVGALALGGCAAEGGGMGEMGVWGYVVSGENAQLEMSAEQPGTTTLAVDRVLAPEDAWIVVHLDDNGAPGMRVGLAHVSEGESLDVEVPLEEVTTQKVIVALHADRGTPDEFDFDMENATGSPDRPFFVDEKELAVVVTVR